MNAKASPTPGHLDLLNIETFIWTPHLETAGEVCLRSAREGSKVGFAYLGKNNPDDALSWKLRLMGAKKRTKVRQFAKLLERQGVKIIRPPSLKPSILDDIAAVSQRSFNNMAELEEFTYKDAAIGLGTASSLISKTKDSNPCLSDNTKLVATYIREALVVFECVISLIEQYRPRTVLTFNGRFALSLPIVEAARAKGIEVLFHERGADSTRFYLHPLQPHDFSYARSRVVQVWDKGGSEKANVGHTFFARRRQGDGIGWTSFTGRQLQGLAPEKSQRRRIVYFTSSDDEYASVGEFRTHFLFTSQRDAIKWLIDYVRGRPETELFIRVHPHLMQKGAGERSWWEGLHGDNTTVIKADEPIDSYALAESADVVVSYGSTIGIEATYWGTPSVLLGDAAYRDANCVYEPASLHELKATLSEDNLSAHSPDNCLPFGYYSLTHGEKFIYYKPHTLFSGSFMGVELSTLSVVGRGLMRLLRALRKPHRPT